MYLKRPLSALALIFLFTVGCKKKDTKTEEPVTPPVVQTSPTPEVSTAPITSIIDTSAIGGGYVTSAGTSAMLAVGICWDTLPAPTTLRRITNDGAGTGNYTSTLRGLKPNKKYYVRAYATNYNGTSYGNEISFTTQSSWTRVNLNAFGINGVHCFAGSGASLFIGTNKGVIFSADTGVTWTSAGLTTKNIFFMTLYGGSLYTQVDGEGIYRSANNGVSWTNVFNSPSVYVNDFTTSGTKIYAAASNGLLQSQSGTVWSYVTSNTLPSLITQVAANGSVVYAASGSPTKLYKSSDDGSSWSLTSFPANAPDITEILINGSTVFVGTTSDAYRSTDNGATWSTYADLDHDIYSISAKGSRLFETAISGNGTMKFSNDNGNSWATESRSGMPAAANLLTGFVNDNYIYISTNIDLFRKKR